MGKDDLINTFQQVQIQRISSEGVPEGILHP